MASLLKIGYYSTMINQMRQGPSYNGKRNKAKPLLLWTIISLVENNILKKNIITLEFLEDRYYKILNDFNVPRTVIIYPFFYLKNDGFWHLKWKYDKETCLFKGRTTAMTLIEQNITPPKEWEYDPELCDDEGNTVAMLLAKKGKNIPE